MNQEKAELQLRQIGAFVKEARFCQGVTQRELAMWSGLHHNTISKIENGKNTNLMNLLNVLGALNFSIYEACCGLE